MGGGKEGEAVQGQAAGWPEEGRLAREERASAWDFRGTLEAHGHCGMGWDGSGQVRRLWG